MNENATNLLNFQSCINSTQYGQNVSHNLSCSIIPVPSASELVSIRNYTKEEINAAFYLTWVCYPILLACCSFGNVMNLILLANMPKKSTMVYMMVAAVSNLFILWLYMPLYLYNISGPLRHDNPAFKRSFQHFYGLQQWGTDTFIHLCDWTLLVFSLERLLVILKPIKFRNMQTARSALIITSILLCLGGLFSVYNAVVRYWMFVHNNEVPGWLELWSVIQRKAEVVMTLFKFSALIVLNGLLVAVLMRHRNSKMGKIRASQGNCADKNKYNNSHKILFACVALYLTTQFPAMVVECLMVAADDGSIIFPRSARLFITPISNTFFLANYSLEFYLYLIFSKRYREQCVKFFGRYLCKFRNGAAFGKGSGTKSSSTQLVSSNSSSMQQTIIELLPVETIHRV